MKPSTGSVRESAEPGFGHDRTTFGSTGSVRESAEPGFGHDRTTFGSTGDDRDGPTGILHRWKSVINSSRPLKVFLWVLKMLF